MSKNKTNSSRIPFKDLQFMIEDYKQKRDDLNKKTKEFINSLQEIEVEINSALKLAKDSYKKKRDYWNDKVKKLKDKKNEYKDLLDNLTEERKKFKKPKGASKETKTFTSIRALDRKIENLERSIETDNLDMNQENAIVDQIKELSAKKQELLSEQKSDELFKIERKIEIVKINLNKIYEQLTKWSNRSQDYHGKMMEMYDKVNQLREQKKQQEEELIENKRSADEFHEKYLEYMNQKKKRAKTKKGQPGGKPKQGGKRPGKQSFRTSSVSSKNDELLEKMKQDKLATAIEKQKAGKKLNIYEARLFLENNKS